MHIILGDMMGIYVEREGASISHPARFISSCDLQRQRVLQAYPYEGVTNFCQKNVSDVVKFKKVRLA